MNQKFAMAFKAWEIDFRAHPEEFITESEVAAMEVLPLSEQRAVCFEAILEKLAQSEP
jgi:hypothetical protein